LVNLCIYKVEGGKENTPSMHQKIRKTITMRKRKSTLEIVGEEQCKIKKITANALEKLADSIQFLGTAIMTLSSTLATADTIESTDILENCTSTAK
jgi:3-methyladenine DNA glycosylase AlkD